MDELKVVGMEYENYRMPFEEKLDYLRSKDIDEEEIEDIKKDRNLLKNHEFPNFIINFTLDKIISYEFSEDVIIRSIEKILSGILKGKIDGMTDGEKVSSTQSVYSAKMICNQQEKRKNREIMVKNSNKEIILIKEFIATTEYGKVIDSILNRQTLKEIPLREDWHIVTSLIETDTNTTYLCFSSELANEIKNQLHEDEYISLPQVDFSDYVNELDEILRHSLFLKICRAEYLSILLDILRRFRENDYSGFSDSYNIIEHVLRNIIASVDGQASKMGKFLDVLAGNTSQRRLFNETECLIKAIGRNIQAHGINDRPEWDKEYLAILSMKAIRDIFLDWCFFEAFYKCLVELSQHIKGTPEDLWKENLEDVKYRKKVAVKYSGEWDKNMRFEIKYRDGKYISDYIFDVSPGGEDINLIDIRRVGP